MLTESKLTNCKLGSEWLVKKYNVAVPRYTSYPPVPKWAELSPDSSEWARRVKDAYLNNKEISLYLHLPFCESLCTYCGCNTRITQNHRVEEPYIQSMLNEWSMYLDVFETTPILGEIHLGGGTPTFFSAGNLCNLLEGIVTSSFVTSKFSFSIEAHPAYTNFQQLQALSDMGCRRISFGVQDSNPVVQKAINRLQSFSQIKSAVELSRKVSFSSINFDLVYGLPFQTLDSLKITINEILQLKPERIAFYSYAHVPWKKPSQRGYSETDLPDVVEKFRMNQLGHELFERAGYVSVGMDHFALPSDKLAVATKNKMLHRNFMGYTDKPTSLLIGLGASSISDSGTAYMQNVKSVESYQKNISQQMFPIEKGHYLTLNEEKMKERVNSLMCNFYTQLDNGFQKLLRKSPAWQQLKEMEENGLIKLTSNSLSVTDVGKYFVRNICAALDFQEGQQESLKLMYSKGI